MFGYEWSRSSGKVMPAVAEAYNGEWLADIEEVAPLAWGEHCIECGVPECYSSCTKYVPRADKRCKRFENGIERIENGCGIFGETARVSFMPWGKMEAILLATTIPYSRVKRLNSAFNRTTSVAKGLPTYLPNRLVYLSREYITRKAGKGCSNPDCLVAELFNPSEPFRVIIENKVDDEIKFRTSFMLEGGYFKAEIPFYQLCYTEGKRNSICIYPEGNSEAELYIYTLDVVKYKKSKQKSNAKIKCVVWDLDNTMWSGILSEGDEVKPFSNITEAVKELDKRGILNSIASKNDNDEAMEKLKELGIDEYFLCPQINWGMKSASIKNIAKILDIGLDTFAFVDDMKYEREEVLNELPMVRAYSPEQIDELMQSEATDIPITEMSAKRRLSYIDIAERNQAYASYEGNLEGFVRLCDIRVKVFKPNESERLRCYELLQRTNQLNLSGERLTQEELYSILDSPDMEAHAIRVKDRYGDYGLVGVGIYEIHGNEAELRHFVLSCRASRKLIEQAYMEYMCSYLQQKGYKRLTIHCAITEKNSLLRSSISDVFGEATKEIDKNHYLVEVNTDDLSTAYSELMSFELTDISF